MFRTAVGVLLITHVFVTNYHVKASAQDYFLIGIEQNSEMM